LAPERFKVEWEESLKDPKLMEPSMDVFSAGCVIAEIFMDGLPLFDLAHL
jgi:phosphoinositide-3-kinase regulatory subunit 4